jgi:hypothetical protein
MKSNWPILTNPAHAARRAAGRRRYQEALRAGRAIRRLEIARSVAAVVAERGFVPRGYYAALARRLRVSRAQVCMDVKAIREDAGTVLGAA